MIVNGYELLNKIGEGAISKVYKAYKNGKFYAIKMMEQIDDEDHEDYEDGVISYYVSELEALHSLNHPNIMKPIETFRDDNSFYVVMPEYSNSVEHAVEDDELTIEDVYNISKKVVGAYAYMHSVGIAHRDAKTQNILLDDKKEPYIIDFNLSRWVRFKTDDLGAATLYYRPPEILDEEKSSLDDTYIDCWSVGCIIAEMLCGRELFKAHSEEELQRWHKYFFRSGAKNELRYRLKEDFKDSDKANELLNLTVNLLKEEPNKRMSMKNAYKQVFQGNTPSVPKTTGKFSLDPKHKWSNNFIKNVAFSMHENACDVDDYTRMLLSKLCDVEEPEELTKLDVCACMDLVSKLVVIEYPNFYDYKFVSNCEFDIEEFYDREMDILEKLNFKIIQ